MLAAKLKNLDEFVEPIVRPLLDALGLQHVPVDGVVVLGIFVWLLTIVALLFYRLWLHRNGYRFGDLSDEGRNVYVGFHGWPVLMLVILIIVGVLRALGL